MAGGSDAAAVVVWRVDFDARKVQMGDIVGAGKIKRSIATMTVGLCGMTVDFVINVLEIVKFQYFGLFHFPLRI